MASIILFIKFYYHITLFAPQIDSVMNEFSIRQIPIIDCG